MLEFCFSSGSGDLFLEQEFIVKHSYSPEPISDAPIVLAKTQVCARMVVLNLDLTNS